MCDLSGAQACYGTTPGASMTVAGAGDLGPSAPQGANVAGAGGPGVGGPGGGGAGGPLASAASADEWPPSDVLEWFAEMQQSVTMYHAWKNWLPDFGFQHCSSTKLCRPMNRPPPLAHSNSGLTSHTQHLFSPPQTPTSTRQDGGMLGVLHGSQPPMSHQGGHLTNLPPISSPTAHPGSTSPSLVVPQPIKGAQPQGHIGASHPGAPGANRGVKTYHCRMCDQIFESKSDLLVHSQHVHKQDPKPYKCPTCNKCFANSSYLSQHARIHSGIKPYKCQICERRFTQLCHLQQHIRTHTGEKPYKCQHPGCGKAFSQLSNLQSHSRSHMTDKPYRCNSCYKCFTDEHSLREHIPKHSETKHLKTHICRICGKSYTQETYLARHMTKHSVDSNGRVPFSNRQLSPSSMMGHHQVPMGHQQDPHDIKPLLDGNGSLSPVCGDPSKPSSAFMPLAHQFQGPIMNSSVPSTLSFPSPRLPNNSLNSPLTHLAPGSMSSRYFPFDPISFPKSRDPMADRGMGMSREGMIANSLLSLQQIKNFSTSHPVFPKSEPSSPGIHKDYPKEFP